MQDNNEDNKNTENEGPKPMGGDVFHPEGTSTPPVSTMPAQTPEVTADTEKTDFAIPPKPTMPPKKASKKILWVLLVLLLVPAAIAAWIFMQTDKAAETSQNSETQDIELLKVGTGEGPAGVYFPSEDNTSLENIVNRQIYEGLVGLENNNVVPFIAQSWTNPDEKTWVFKIRPNVKFHTGNPVTAEAVKASLDSLKQYDYWSLFVSTIESTEVTGDLEVTIKTTEPDALLLNRLVLAYITDLSVKDKSGNDGTGAYQVDTSVPKDEKIETLVAFDGYYRGHVKTRKLQYIVYESDDAIAKAMVNKEINIAQTLPFPEIKSQLDPLGHKVIEYESPGTFGMYLNQIRDKSPILKNKDFRTAVALAMDRQNLIDQTGNKNTASTQVIPKSLPGYDESLAFPAFNLDAAKAALAKSGYKGEKLDFLYITELQVDPPILIKQLEALGVKINAKGYDAEDVDTALGEIRNGNFDFFSAGYTSDIADARDILGALLETDEQTYPTYSDPTYDELLAESDRTFDPTERIKILQKASKHIQDNVAWIPLRNGVYINYIEKDIDIKDEFNGTGNLGAYYWKVGRTN
jgi:peptide/nickel transport system substrate-binding protein